MDLATLWNFQNGPPAFSATYFCPILCRVVQSFGSNGDDPLLSAALWIQALDSREETEKKIKKFLHTNIRRIHSLIMAADASISVTLSF